MKGRSGRDASRRVWRRALIGLAASCLLAAGGGVAAEYYGEEGGFEVVLNEHGDCEASRGVHFTDADGQSHFAAMTFGLTVEDGQLLSMLSLHSQSFYFDPGESRRASAAFDGRRHEAVYVADSSRMVTTYMSPDRIRDIAGAHHIELTLFDGSTIRVPLEGTFVASRLVAGCYYRHLSGYARSGNPFASR